MCHNTDVLKGRKMLCTGTQQICKKKKMWAWPWVEGFGGERPCVRRRWSVCACIKIGDFLVRVAEVGISLGSD